MKPISNSLGRALGRWWVCGLLFAASILMFAWIVPHAAAAVTAGGTLAPKILDEYYLTWTAEDARRFYAAIGAQGRAAYRAYYLNLDFWLPVLTLTLCYISLLSLAFRPGFALELGKSSAAAHVCERRGGEPQPLHHGG